MKYLDMVKDDFLGQMTVIQQIKTFLVIEPKSSLPSL